MKFSDLVSIREAECCEKCSSFEYELPFQIDGELVKSLAFLFVENFDDRSLKFKGTMQLKKDENTKLEFKMGNRYFKLCLPKIEFQTLKNAVEAELDSWILGHFEKVGA